jgi:hypothetical protein
MKDLRCPYCGDFISIKNRWVGPAYASYEAHTGYECDNYQCGAEWDTIGKATVDSRI